MSGNPNSPLLFVFNRVLKDSFEVSSGETENYSELLEADWFAFWETRGNEIVNCSWSQKYSAYLLEEKAEETEADLEEKSAEDIHEGNELQAPSDCQSWQEIWDEHYANIYGTTYQLFQIVHYVQYCFYRHPIEEVIEELASESQEDELDIQDVTDQLQSLGLPTSFVSRETRHRYPRHNSSSELLSDEEEEMAPAQKQAPASHPKKKKNRKLRQIPKLILEDKSLRTYWQKRFSLFSRFDAGIQLDRESWFSVTPEKVAIHMAERLRCDTIIDAFCGSGGNAIQFAYTCTKVIAIDIDPEKIKNAQHNAVIYGVEDKIDFIIGDYLQLCDSLKGDVVFLSPPWGGPRYVSKKEYDIEESLKPLGATALAEKSRQISENIAFFLPKNSNPKQIAKLAGVGNRVEIEHNFLDSRLIGLTAIYGEWLIDKKNLRD